MSSLQSEQSSKYEKHEPDTVPSTAAPESDHGTFLSVVRTGTPVIVRKRRTWPPPPASGFKPSEVRRMLVRGLWSIGVAVSLAVVALPTTAKADCPSQLVASSASDLSLPNVRLEERTPVPRFRSSSPPLCLGPECAARSAARIPPPEEAGPKVPLRTVSR